MRSPCENTKKELVQMSNGHRRYQWYWVPLDAKQFGVNTIDNKSPPFQLQYMQLVYDISPVTNCPGILSCRETHREGFIRRIIRTGMKDEVFT